MFQLGILVGLALFMGVGLWCVKAQAEYLDLYRAKIDPELPTREQIAARYAREPWRWLIEAPNLLKRMGSVSFQPQADPELEAARLRAKHRERAVWLAWFAYPLVVLVVANIRM